MNAATSKKACLSTQGQTLEEIVTQQKDYYATGVIRSTEFRTNQLLKLLRAIKNEEQQILAALQEDLKRSREESLLVEITTVCEEISYVLSHLDEWTKESSSPTPLFLLPSKSKIFYEPLGQVLIISPWNYPFMLLMSPLIGAISAGNTVVLKPSEFAPKTAEIVNRMLSSIFDERFVAVFEGGPQVSESLLSQKWDHILFTGSTKIGKIVATKAAEHLTPITLELGGKSPCIVDDQCDLELAAKRIAWAKCVNLGQTCVAPDYLLIQNRVKPRFVELFRSAIKGFYGSHIKDSSDYGRVISHSHMDRFLRLLKDQKILFGGQSDTDNLYLEPTLVDEPDLSSPIMTEEIFGPILPVISYNLLEDAIKIIQSKEKPLALYIYSNNQKHIDEVLHTISFGGGMVNDCVLHAANHFLPFGGVGKSGMGAYRGRHSFETFSHKKSVMFSPIKVDPSLRYPPYGGVKEKLLRILFKL